MNIVQLANFYAPESGGLRVAVDRLRSGYRAAGHQCTAIVPGRLDASLETTRTLRSPRLTPSSNYRVIVRPAAVRALLDDLRPDRLEVHDKFLQPWVWRWAKDNQVPTVLVSHERLANTLPALLPVLPIAAVRAVAEAITGKAGARCDAIVTCSAFSAADFVSTPVEVHVVPLGVDLETFRPLPNRATSNRGVRLVVVSRLSAEKRVDVAIDAVRVLAGRGVEATLVVVGSGPAEHRLRRRSAGLPVKFRGYEPDRRRVAELLSGADVALAPGPAETFGLAALEALACGTAVVAVENSGAGEFVNTWPNAGRAVAGDAAAFASAVESLLRIPGALRRQAARERATCFSWPRAVRGMLDIHAGLRVSQRRASRTVLAMTSLCVLVFASHS